MKEDMEEVPKPSPNSSSIGTKNAEEKKLKSTSVGATKFHTDCQKEHEASLDCEPISFPFSICHAVIL